ncbi:MAG TPA: deoxyribose-phosphate aldolase [Geminicoccus sp.]|jgi:deoxyribose-phosphate aldolase|uniref:deoxyribose-phosphate aldolase n=1 Tax=Geminicoccus sp. TaxID=2024832 RepID=UPI002E31038C|nr:deoxyribose-phosphate aldolase [Geminicoccus sp.]HEX2525517.1 deoxyribose-phosphate aldolase [Geminicoccus sp.]
MIDRNTQDLLAQAAEASPTPELARRAIRLVDLTSLSGQETEAEIDALCHKAVANHVAAVCLYPVFLRQARPLLAGSEVRLAAVANFPDGSDDIARAADEAAAAVADGADEVDVVAPVNAIMEGDVGIVGELIEAVRVAIGPSTTLKLILETGILADPDRITAAARAGVMAGVNFLKTSTGKVPVGATPEAAAVLMQVCEDAGLRVGFKASGGIRTARDAAQYLALGDAIMGKDRITARTFRFGASSLLDDLLRVAGGGSSAEGGSGY